MKRKNIANQVLAGVILLFVIANVLKYFYRESLAIQLFSFVAEAAVVGGVADWFAVTALFRRPLGFPWHTALITRHRERVIQSIADMIQNELLSVDSIKKRVNAICLVDVLIDWAENKNGKLILKKMVNQYSSEALSSIDSMAAAMYIEKIFENKSKELKLTHHIKNMAQWALTDDRYKKLVSDSIDECITALERSDLRQSIYTQLVKMSDQQTKTIFERAIFWLAEQTDSVNLSEAADAMYEELIIMLREAKKTDHMLYQWINAKLIELIDELEHSGSWAEAIEEGKQALIKSMDLAEMAEKSAQIALEIIKSSSHSLVLAWFYEQVEMYWTSFKQNKEAQIWLEMSVKQALYKVIENEHQLIGIAVQGVLNNFSDDDLNDFIEEKAGDDLQWIRINGCVVGSIVGLVMFIFLHYVYDPFIVPMVQGIIR